MSKKNWFDVDGDGFGQINARKDRGRTILELVQNAVDEEGTTTVEILLEPIPGRPAVRLMVRDDNPEGFADLRDSFGALESTIGTVRYPCEPRQMRTRPP